VAASVAALKSAGALDVVVWNVANVATTPESIGLATSFTSAVGAPSYAEIGDQLSDAMNGALASAVGSFSRVYIFDFDGVLQNAVTNGTFANVTDACAASLTCDPSKYLYWDGIHPTSAMHGVLSTAMVDFVNAVPEPHTYALMLGGIAVIGAVVNLRRRLQRTQATYR
jgi:outer membrane lipase/esterase